MRVVCFDPVGGAAGDMILGSLLDLGVSVEDVEKHLRSMGLEPFELSFQRVPDKHGIAYGRLEVAAKESPTHRRLNDIEAIINSGDFSQPTRDRATAIFRHLAEAEARVHGIPIDHVHFHEVGAVDAIIDIVGSVIALEMLDVESVFCSPIPIGRGTVATAHGVLPVPSPATAELLKGHCIIRRDVDQELTTPTGAAILTALSQGDWSGRPMLIMQVGSGLGTRSIKGMPNIIRAFLADMESGAESQEIDVIESDIDDDTPEVISDVTNVLRDVGALDVTVCPILMKKGRAGFRLTVLGQRGSATLLSNVLFSHSSTIGVRVTTARRLILPRSVVTVATRWGDISAKRIERPNRVEIVPEFEECKRIAEANSVSTREVMQEVITHAQSR